MTGNKLQPRNAGGTQAASGPPARLVVIGPLPPFRSGIAQHTAMMCQALAAQTDLVAISFKRQYPQWLFPGQSDRDPDAVPPDGIEAHYVIDPLNPFTWRRAVRLLRRHRPDRVVIVWWTVFWAPCFGYLAWICRRQGLHVRLFCHNAVEHETSWWRALLTRAVMRRASSFVVHTGADQANILRDLPHADIAVRPHPIYSQFPAPGTVGRRRRGLELLFFGLVRPYKGLDVLIEAMGRLRGSDVFLTIAGEFWSGREEIERRIEALGIEDQIELIPRYVSDAEAADLFARADVVVLPYRSATGSGVVALAYHYGKPVIATRVGGLPDVIVDGETGVLVPPGRPEALVEAISALPAERAQAMAPAIRDLTAEMTWDNLARVVAA